MSNKNKLMEGELIVKMRCPFCDGIGKLDWILREGYEEAKDDSDAKAYFIRCKSCASNGGWSKSPSGALKMWNMRQQKPTVTREWVIKWREKLLLRGLDRDIGELSIEQICEELGVEVEE